MGKHMQSILILLLSITLLSPKYFAQSKYLMNLTNGEKTKTNEIEFDVFIKSTDSCFTLTSYQCSFSCSVGNLTSPSFSYIPGSSQLINFPRNGIGIRNTDGMPELTFASSAGSDKIDTSLIKIGRFRLKNSNSFSAGEFRILWNFSGVINTIITGSRFADITYPSMHTDLVFYPDTTSPELVKAECIGVNKVRLDFSEELDQTSALNINNYSIDNDITIHEASLSPEGKCVTLTTCDHAVNKIYTITASSLLDRSGNAISTESNCFQYSFNVLHKLSLKLFLQGPYKNGKMKTYLSQLNLIPRMQPYSNSPWNYNGSEYIDTVPGNVVDWVLIELRTAREDSSIKYRTTALLKNNGNLQDPCGNEYLTITNMPGGNYYVVVKHRNHIPVMSSIPVILSEDSVSAYDFSSSANQAYGNTEAELGENVFGIYSGDGNGNGIINDFDYKDIWKNENGTMGYKAGDFDLNGGVNIADKNLYWKINHGKVSQVP